METISHILDLTILSGADLGYAESVGSIYVFFL